MIGKITQQRPRGKRNMRASPLLIRRDFAFARNLFCTPVLSLLLDIEVTTNRNPSTQPPQED